MGNAPAPSPVTRIYVTPEGDLLVTDLWTEVESWLGDIGFENTSQGETTGEKNENN